MESVGVCPMEEIIVMRDNLNYLHLFCDFVVFFSFFVCAVPYIDRYDYYENLILSINDN